MQKKLNISKDAKVEIQWNVRPVDYSNEKADEIRSKMASKYGIPKKNVRINANFIKKGVDGKNEVATADIVQNIQDPKFQQELFKAYIEENEIVDYDFDTILNIDNQLNASIDYSVYDKFRRYTIEWVRWSNFLSYGKDNYIDFTTLDGLVLLKSEPANQGGKTNFACDLIEFLLFGSVGSGKADVLKKIFNKHLPDETEVKVEGGIEIDGEHYIIRRTLTRPQKKKRTAKSVVTQKVEYFRVVDGTEIILDDTENLEAESNTQTNKIIKEAIGNKKDFNLVVSANADNLKELVSMKDTERGKLLSRWIGLLPLEEKDIKAREKWNKEISPSLLSGKYNKEELKECVETGKNEIKNLQALCETADKKKKECEENIASFNKERDEILQLRQYVDKALSSLDVVTLTTKQTNVINEGKILNQQIAQVDEAISALGEIDYSDEEYHELTEKKNLLITEIATIKSTINSLRAYNDNLAKSEYCPTCGQKLVDVDNSSLIAANTEKINSSIDNGIAKNATLQEVNNRLSEIEDMRKKHLEKSRLEVKKSSLSVSVANKRNEYTEITNTIKELNRCKEAIEYNNKIDTKAEVLRVNIVNEDTIKSKLIGEIQSYNKEIQHIQESNSKYEILIEKLESEEKIIKSCILYLTMVGKNGISKMVLRNTLPIINAELKRLLTDICDFDV